jgi:hypothetical protein
MKQITEFEIVDHGVEHEQYFQGCGVAFTKFEECYTGSAKSAREALNDALEQLASAGEYDVMTAEADLSQALDEMSDKSDVPHNGHDFYHYVSIRVR